MDVFLPSIKDVENAFWIDDIPYIWTDEERRYVQDSGNIEKFVKYMEKCENEKVSKFFRIISLPQLVTKKKYVYTFRKNGRNFFPIKQIDNPDQPHIPKSMLSFIKPVLRNFKKQAMVTRIVDRYENFSELYEIFASEGLNDKEIQLSTLICSQFKKSQDWLANLAELVENLSNKDVQECTPVGQKIAASLIKIAALRIFSEPEQSIMELPVNSMDSYDPASRVGKFGMGFFSILYWLIDHPLRNMIITSYYNSDSGQVNGYMLKIRYTKEGLVFSVRVLDSSVKQTGTSIIIDTGTDKFSNQEVSGFVSQMGRLHFAPIAKLSVTTNQAYFRDINLINRDTSSGSKHEVFCIANGNGILVEDYASGIPLPVVFQSLFVPSISTKTISAKVTREFINGTDIIPRDDNKYYLYVVVNGVSVVQMRATHLQSAQTGFGFDVIIDMPADTQLPVSRDDIILNKHTTKIFTDNLIKLYEINMTKIHTVKGVEYIEKNVGNIYLLLQDYKNYTSNREIKEIISKVWSYICEKYGDRFIIDGNNYRKVFDTMGNDFILSTEIFPARLQDKLDKNNNIKKLDNIFYGKRVVILHDIQTTSAGLPSYIFVNQNITQKPSWTTDIAMYYTDEILFPISNNHTKTLSSDISKNITALKIKNKALRDKLSEFFTYLESLRTYYILSDEFHIRLSRYMFQQIAALGEDSMFKTLDSMSVQINLMKQIKQSYGNNQPRCRVIYYISKKEPLIPIDTKNKLYPKCRNVLLDWQSFGLRTTPEYTSGENMFEYWGHGFTTHIQASINSNPKLHKELLEACLEKSSDYRFVIVMLCFANAHTDPFRITGVEFTRERLLLFVEYMYSYINTKIFLSDSFYRTLFRDYEFDRAKEFIQLSDEAQTWLQNSENYKNLPIINMPNFAPKYSDFTIRNMIDYLFKNSINFDEPKGLEKFYEGVQKHKDISKMQLVEIAINEGTTRNALEATILELTQNSVDAIRLTYSNPNIESRVGVTPDKQYLVWEIKDFVGMTDKSFIFMSIPFLSTKEPSALVGGEMGSGFFNIYRESEFVYISSSIDGHAREYFDIPIKDSDGRVIDVRKQVNFKKSEDRGTIIRSYMKLGNDINESIDKIGKIFFVSNHILGGIPGMKYSLNSNLLSQDMELYYADEAFEIRIEKDKEPKILSYILTKGIPYMPLENIIKKLFVNLKVIPSWISKGILINILHGAFTPTQTRTSIRMSEQTEKQFTEIVLKSIFLGTLYRYTTTNSIYEKDMIIPNSSSTANIKQLLFHDQSKKILDSSSITDVILYYEYVVLLKTDRYTYRKSFWLSQAINDLIFNHDKLTFPWPIGTSGIDIKTADEYQLKLYKLIYKAVIMWFSNKKTEKEVPPQNVDIESEKNEIHQFSLSLKVLQNWVDVFWDIAKELQIEGYKDKAPKVLLVQEADFSGAYDVAFHLMYLNADYFTIPGSKISMVDITDAFRKKNKTNILNFGYLSYNSPWKLFFGLIIPASIIPHELEHARRHSGHNRSSGAHDVVRGQIIPGDSRTEFTFDEISLAVYSKVLENGFYDRLFQTF